MKSYPTITNAPVNMTRLRMDLCNNNPSICDKGRKLPPEAECIENLDLYAKNGDWLGNFEVHVKRTDPSIKIRRGNGARRIFVMHKGRLVPVGNLAQAKL